MKKSIYCIILLSCTALTAIAQYTIPPKMEWWYQARFGMFIHYGSYSTYEQGEWVQFLDSIPKPWYQDSITKQFNVEQFNAQHIVSLAKQAGMKYIVITAKHHEGFALWKTQAQSFRDYTGTYLFDIYHYTGIQRDILKELQEECEKQQVEFGLYYSILDWNHSTQKAHNYFSIMHDLDLKELYVNDMKVQLKELITTYNPKILWFDGDWCADTTPVSNFNWWNKADAVDLCNYIHSLDSSIIINERIKRDCDIGDFMCPEEKIPATPLPRPWETCQTMNGAWGYKASAKSDYKLADTLIQELVAIVSRDGNYLLNISPQGTGAISYDDIHILEQFGAWMNINGESIYGANRSPFTQEPAWGYFTSKPQKLYAHIFYMPANNTITIPVTDKKIVHVYDLVSQTPLTFAHTQAGTHISIPPETHKKISSCIVIEWE
ncbi:MAG: alpha-L-fucosidase [Bacteroidales bacterium]|nr:alpha-L-fucosidase [Bacteroidales bacterium]